MRRGGSTGGAVARWSRPTRRSVHRSGWTRPGTPLGRCTRRNRRAPARHPVGNRHLVPSLPPFPTGAAPTIVVTPRGPWLYPKSGFQLVENLAWTIARVRVKLPRMNRPSKDGAASRVTRRTTIPRTLVVTNDFPPRVGGVQQYVWNVVNNLPAKRVAVFAPSWPGWREHDAASMFPMHRWPSSFLWPTEELWRRVTSLIQEHDT